MNQEQISFLSKILIPATVAMVVKTAIEIKKGTATFWNSLLSLIIGVGTAYIFAEWILATIQDKYVILTVAFIAIIGDKIGSWLIFQFKIDAFMDKLTRAIIETLTGKRIE